MPEGRKTETSHKAWSAGASSALVILTALGAALLTGQVDIPPEAEINGAVMALFGTAAAGVSAWIGAYYKRNWPK